MVLRQHARRYYPGLGAVDDFHDDLLAFAYDSQRICDSENTAYYLECLQGIADGRHSEALLTKVAIEASSDIISFRDIRAAYKELGLNAQTKYEDETILGTFHSRIVDAPKQEPELRRALKIIGQNRSSHQIQVIASQSTRIQRTALYDFADLF